MAEWITSKTNATVQQILQQAGFWTLTVLIEVLLTMCTAYLAITLSATLLQNKKGFLKGLISILLFVALSWGSSWLAQKLLYERVALGIVEACHHGHLLAVVAGEVDVVIVRIALVKPDHLLQCMVGTPVVHHQELPIVVGIVGYHLLHVLDDQRERCLLVIGGQ